MKIEDLIEKNKKISFLLGMSIMFLMELDDQLELPMHQKERVKYLVCRACDFVYAELAESKND